MARKIHKAQREKIAAKFQGRCAYCAHPLGDRWHADHVDPIMRGWTDSDLEKFKMTRGDDSIENLVPSCERCNLRKSKMSAGLFKMEIRALAGQLYRESSAFRMAVDFGVVKINRAPRVVFLFEEVTP
jgi:5-methylcytosine-specific restriction endonuclease McrA